MFTEKHFVNLNQTYINDKTLSGHTENLVLEHKKRVPSSKIGIESGLSKFGDNDFIFYEDTSEILYEDGEYKEHLVKPLIYKEDQNGKIVIACEDEDYHIEFSQDDKDLLLKLVELLQLFVEHLAEQTKIIPDFEGKEKRLEKLYAR